MDALGGKRSKYVRHLHSWVPFATTRHRRGKEWRDHLLQEGPCRALYGELTYHAYYYNKNGEDRESTRYTNPVSISILQRLGQRLFISVRPTKGRQWRGRTVERKSVATGLPQIGRCNIFA